MKGPVKPALRQVNLRIRVEDIEEAQRQSEKTGIPYHVILREALTRGLRKKGEVK